MQQLVGIPLHHPLDKLAILLRHPLKLVHYMAEFCLTQLIKSLSERNQDGHHIQRPIPGAERRLLLPHNLFRPSRLPLPLLNVGSNHRL